jgi:hypothetical protein
VTDDPTKPAEAMLLDDPATADLAAKVSAAWSDFSRALGEAIPALPAGTTLDIALDPAASGVGDVLYEVSVIVEDSAEMRAYAVSNAMLPEPHRLSRAAVGELVALGWSPPGVDSPGDQRFSLRLPVAQAARTAAILTRTLREIYGAPHPAFLMYVVGSVHEEPTAAAATGTTPPLGAARLLNREAEEPALPANSDLLAMPLPDKVGTVIAAMLKTTPEQLPVDKDGDIGIRSGSAMVFVRVRDNPPLIDVFSPVLTNIEPTEKLFARLSDLTHRMPIGRLYCASGTVWASIPVFGRDFQATHLMLALEVMTGLADELDDRLHGEFGGRRFFVEADGSGLAPAGEDRTGMYL